MKFIDRVFGGIVLPLLLLAERGSCFPPRWASVQSELNLAAAMGVDADHILFGGKVEKPRETNVTVYYAEIPIDHKNISFGTYKNRYWTSFDYYQPGGPIFVFDVGDGGDGQPYANWYLRNKTILVDLMREFKGAGIVWEHRYYGESNPFPVNLNTTSEQFQYLTVEQALADIPYFSKSFKWAKLPKSNGTVPDLTSSATPWVFLGGSYPGNRAVFSRELYPDSIFASYAASAPIQARVNDAPYYDVVYKGLNAFGYGNCTKDVRAAYKYIDSELQKGGEAAAEIMKTFLGPGAEINTPINFSGALSYLWVSFQAFGPRQGIGEFCDWLETDPATGKIASAEGWAPKLGDKAMAHRFATWDKLIPLVNKNVPANCNRTDPKKPLDCDLGKRDPIPLQITWSWQTCTQMGGFSPYDSYNGLVSTFQTLDSFQQFCYQQFPDGLSSGYLPLHPKTEELNAFTKGWLANPSNTYYSDGDYDPWRMASKFSEQPETPKFTITQEIPECGKKNPVDLVFGTLIPNGLHCYGMYTDYKPADPSRELFKSALHKWLPCFKNQTH